jgi:hypothetical protein
VAITCEQANSVIVWFEDEPNGVVALLQAQKTARNEQAHLTVLAVAAHERVIGCGRCLQGTVLWNIEMRKIAHEELLTARRILDDAIDVSYELVVGEPADSISDLAERTGASTVVLPWQRNRRLDPPSRRNVRQRVDANGPWRVICGPRLGRR